MIRSRATVAVLFVAFWACALFAGATGGRTLAILVPIGAFILLRGWGMLVNKHGMWDQHLDDERVRGEGIQRLPFGRAAWALERSDHEIHRGMGGALALLIGPIVAGLGVLFALGVLGS